MKTHESVSQSNSSPVVGGKSKPDTETQQSITQRVASSAHETIDSAAGKAEELESQLRAGAVKAANQLEETQDAATAKVDKSLVQLESFVKGRPVAAAGIAFALGVLATALLRR